MQFDTLADIQAAGFTRATPINQLRQSNCRQIPDRPGVYVVLRTAITEPEFLEESVGAHFRGRNPSLPVVSLSQQWVSRTAVIYIGQTTISLRDRLRGLLKFGLGTPVGHWGGRCIWQLADAERLCLAWKATSAQDAPLVEAQLIQEFKSAYGRRPFANLRD